MRTYLITTPSATSFWTKLASSLTLFCFISSSSLFAEESPQVQKGLVKVYAIHSSPDQYNPWSMHGARSSTGSGSIISGKRILTNAHVVRDQTYVQVRKQGSPRRFQARVLEVSHDADLALLTVDEPGFFDGVTPLAFGTLPNTQEDVLVYGFPLGGDTMSTTKGVVSRIEHRVYAHSSSYLLAGQIDNAINAGNSGGPVIQDGKIVGVVMQSLTQADNIGYMVPVDVVQHFLEDLKDKKYDGFPSLGVVMQGMENADLKKRFLLAPEQTGMLITRILPGSSAEGVLELNDILLSVNGYEVADDGTIDFRDGERTSISWALQKQQIGDSVTVKVLRGGITQVMSITLNRAFNDDRLIPMETYDELPHYYIYGGFVFCRLTKGLLQAWGNGWYNKAPKNLTAMLSDNFSSADKEEVVLILKVLAAQVNQGYHEVLNWVVDEVNGSEVRSLEQLIQFVEQGQDEFVEFKNANGGLIVLSHENALKTNEEILKTYRIQYDRSEHYR